MSHAQASDLAALHKRERAEFNDLIGKGLLKRRTAYYLRRVGELLETGSSRRAGVNASTFTARSTWRPGKPG
jgi:hypothetical protein